MFSRKLVCIVISLVFVITSCTPKVGEAPPEQGQQKLEGTQCLSSLQPVIEAFIAGTATKESIEGGWECAATGIKKFKKYVYGRASDRFETDELVQFLQQNFLAPTSPAITTELSTEFMRIKQLFIGGSLDYVTRAELDKIIDMLGDLKVISLHLNPYMKLIAQKWSLAKSGDVQKDIKYFESASDEIQEAARLLANMIIENNQTYELDHFVTFIKEFSLFVNQDWPIANQIDKLMPVIKKVKKAVSGGDQEKIGPTEWKSFVLLGVRGYLQYLRYFYFIKSASDTGSGIRLGYLARSIEDLLGAFQELLLQKPIDPSCGTATLADGSRVAIACISKKEVNEILTTFSDMWVEFRVSDKLVDEGMKLKKVVFGGSELTLTSRDFERGKNKIAGLKGVVEKFLPFYAVYSNEWDRSNFSYAAAQDFFKQAQDSLQSSAEEVGGLFEDSYNIDSFNGFLAEVAVLYPPQDPTKQPVSDFQKYVPLLKDIKNIVFSEKDSLIKKDQWAPFLKYAARFYSSYLYFNYFVEKEESGTPRFLEAFKTLTDQVLAVTKDVIKGKKTKYISADEVDQVAFRLVELGMLPADLDKKSLQDLIRLALNRVLWPAEERLKGSKPNAINLDSLGNVKTEMQIWYETEKYLYSLTASPLKLVDLQKAIDKKLKDSKISDELKAGLTELVLSASGPVVQTIDKSGRLVITNITPQSYEMASVARLNLNRTISRILIRAATTSLDRLKKYQGVTLPEAQAVFDVIRPVAVELGFLKEDNTTFMESRFREANIFVAHSNGDSYMSFQETSDIAGMILSGITVNKNFKKEVEANCTIYHKVVRTRDEPYLEEQCLRKIYLARTDDFLTATPEHVKFFAKMSTDDASDFLENVLKAAGHEPNSKKTVEVVDADLAPHVIQYIEMTMSKYDANKNGKINLDEARMAFPSFEGILKELTKDQSLIKEKDLFALFAYILYYGKPPGGAKDFLFKWLPWKSKNGQENLWPNIAADRQELASILGYIADQVAASKKTSKLIIIEEEDSIRQSPEYLIDDSEDRGPHI
jgi:hypothetical protein